MLTINVHRTYTLTCHVRAVREHTSTHVPQLGTLMRVMIVVRFNLRVPQCVPAVSAQNCRRLPIINPSLARGESAPRARFYASRPGIASSDLIWPARDPGLRTPGEACVRDYLRGTCLKPFSSTRLLPAAKVHPSRNRCTIRRSLDYECDQRRGPPRASLKSARAAEKTC